MIQSQRFGMWISSFYLASIGPDPDGTCRSPRPASRAQAGMYSTMPVRSEWELHYTEPTEGFQGTAHRSSLLGVDGEPVVQELIDDVFDYVADDLSCRDRTQNAFPPCCGTENNLTIP